MFALCLWALGFSGCESVQEVRESGRDIGTTSGTGADSGALLAPGRNLIFVVIDTLRADHLSYAGYVRETSPSLDRFAGSAVIFTQAIAQETETGPSLGSMFTSLYPNELGLVDNGSVLPSSAETLAERLQCEGYHTASVISSPNAGFRTGLDQGFDEIIEVWKELPAGVSDPKAEYVTAWAMRVLESVAGEDQPFFLYVHYIDPHTPYTPPQRFVGMFTDAVRRREKPNLLGDGAAFWGSLHYLTEHVGQITPNVRLEGRSDVSYYVSQYDGEIRYLDEHLGEFLVGIDSDAGAQTVIVVTSDHGESLGEHDTYFAHGTNTYDEQAHIPLLIRVPGRDIKVERVDEQVSAIVPAPSTLLVMRPANTKVSRGTDSNVSAIPLTSAQRYVPRYTPANSQKWGLSGFPNAILGPFGVFRG